MKKFLAVLLSVVLCAAVAYSVCAEEVAPAEDVVVVAEDELHAERCARCSSDDFKKAKLEVIEIDVSDTAEERVILKANTGA